MSTYGNATKSMTMGELIQVTGLVVEAIEQGNLNAVKYYVPSMISPNSLSFGNGRKLIDIARYHGQQDIVRYLEGQIIRQERIDRFRGSASTLVSEDTLGGSASTTFQNPVPQNPVPQREPTLYGGVTRDRFRGDASTLVSEDTFEESPSSFQNSLFRNPVPQSEPTLYGGVTKDRLDRFTGDASTLVSENTYGGSASSGFANRVSDIDPRGDLARSIGIVIEAIENNDLRTVQYFVPRIVKPNSESTNKYQIIDIAKHLRKQQIVDYLENILKKEQEERVQKLDKYVEAVTLVRNLISNGDPHEMSFFIRNNFNTLFPLNNRVQNTELLNALVNLAQQKGGDTLKVMNFMVVPQIQGRASDRFNQ